VDACDPGAAPEPGAPPLSTLQPPLLTARDDATAARLGGRPLQPNGSIAGYIAQPPGLITTLAGARAFSDYLFAGLSPSRAISAVRVRVEGVTGIDAVSRERSRQAAERIAAATGLEVDITAGASGAPTAVELPACRLGRPAARAQRDVGAQGRGRARAERGRPQEPAAVRADPRRLRAVRDQRGERRRAGAPR